MLQNIEKLEKRLWSAADQLRSNSGLGSNEYFLPVLGILFLRQAYTRFVAVTPEVQKNLPSRGGQKRAATMDDYTKRRSIFLLTAIRRKMSRRRVKSPSSISTDNTLMPGITLTLRLEIPIMKE